MNRALNFVFDATCELGSAWLRLLSRDTVTYGAHYRRPKNPIKSRGRLSFFVFPSSPKTSDKGECVEASTAVSSVSSSRSSPNCTTVSCKSPLQASHVRPVLCRWRPLWGFVAVTSNVRRYVVPTPSPSSEDSSHPPPPPPPSPPPPPPPLPPHFSFLQHSRYTLPSGRASTGTRGERKR